MRWDGVRGRDRRSTDKYLVLVQDNCGGYTAYEIGTVGDAVDNGVPIYYTEENAFTRQRDLGLRRRYMLGWGCAMLVLGNINTDGTADVAYSKAVPGTYGDIERRRL